MIRLFPRAGSQQSLGYVEKTSGDVTTVGDIAGMAITFTTDGRPFEVWYDAMLKHSLAGGVTFLTLWRGATSEDQKLVGTGGANGSAPASGRKVFNLPAGTYTFKLALSNFGGGTSTAMANANNILKLGANYR